jgi:hypothetical protein
MKQFNLIRYSTKNYTANLKNRARVVYKKMAGKLKG